MLQSSYSPRRFSLRRLLALAPFLLLCSALGQTDPKVAAIQRACSGGVLTPEECRAQLEKLKQPGRASSNTPGQATPSSGVGHWADPKGRYTIAIAPGWTVDDSKGNLKVSKGMSWAIFDTETGKPDPMDVARTNAEQMHGMVAGWQVVQQEYFETPKHHACAGVVAVANVTDRAGSRPRVLNFVAQSAGSGNYVTMTGSSLKESATIDGNEVMSMFNSIRFPSDPK